MEYFDLPLSSGITLPPEDSAALLLLRTVHAQHATITLGDDQEKVATPVVTPFDHPKSISISTTSNLSLEFGHAASDLVLVSSDNVYFYVHSSQLLSISSNRMGGIIPDSMDADNLHCEPGTSLVVRIQEPSTVANIVLHTMYGLACMQYLPTLEAVEAALEALSASYGVSVQEHAAPQLPLYPLIMSFAPYRPLDAYALAGHYGLEELAVAISSHLLAYDLSRLPDAAAQEMGPIYLKRLFLLHQSRLRALRDILHQPPATHPPVPQACSPDRQGLITRAWAFAVAQVVWDVLPSVSTSALWSLFDPIGAATTCPHCQAAVQRRVQEVLFEWSSVKVCPRLGHSSP